MERKLAAILATDVVGYSRLMERDELGTYAALKARRKTMFEPLMRNHGGNVIKLTGDGALVEFPSIGSALACAVAIQRRNAEENAALPEARRMHLRIGINAGEVLVDEGDIHGMGVNLAARLQGVAPPGGICVSGAVMQQSPPVEGVRPRYRGRERLHNIAEPVEVYEIDFDGRLSPAEAAGEPQVPADRPSVAILPFQNLGGEGMQQYFTDGITRDLITELSRFRSLFVISAASSFRFRDSAADRARIGRELGVRYVGDGTVQRAGRQLRITVALVDARTGAQIWGERYSEDSDDPTLVQERLVHDITTRLHTQLEHAELGKIRRKPPASLMSYDLWLQGATRHETTTPEGYAEARDLYLRAIEIDPGFARPYVGLAEIAYTNWLLSDWGSPAKGDCTEAADYAQKALELDSQDANGHAVAAWVAMARHEFARAERHWQLARTLNPNDADLIMWRSTAETFLGEPERGIESAQLAMRLNPFHPDWYLSDYAVTLFFARRFEEMLQVYDAIPEIFVHTAGWRAAAYAHLGRMEEARERAEAFARNIRAIWAGPSNATPADYGRWFRRCIPLRRREEQEIMETGLRCAGLLD